MRNITYLKMLFNLEILSLTLILIIIITHCDKENNGIFKKTMIFFSVSIESWKRGWLAAGLMFPRAAASERRFRSELRFKLRLRLGRYNIIISRLYVVFITLLNIHRAIISY